MCLFVYACDLAIACFIAVCLNNPLNNLKIIEKIASVILLLLKGSIYIITGGIWLLMVGLLFVFPERIGFYDNRSQCYDNQRNDQISNIILHPL